MKKIFIGVALGFLLLVAMPLWASSLLLLDEQGAPLGRVPYMELGEEQLVPLSDIASKSGWPLESESGTEILRIDTLVLRARNNNPFYFLNDQCRQFTFAPQEWDGALWVPLSGLFSAFPHELFHQHPQDGSLRIRRSTVEEVRVTTLTSPVDVSISPTPPSSSVWTLNTIIIDPGHGGKDPGAVSPNGTQEKGIVLDISRRLARILLDKGLVAKLTRNDDSFIPLKERTRLANANRGDLFISIHCNSSKYRQARGSEAYFLSPARTQKAIDVAILENSVVQFEEDAEQYQDLTEENYILLTMATSQYLKDSESFANLTLKEIAHRTPMPQRGIDQAGFYVLIGASMPAILFEAGFLSNSDDEKILSSKRGRQKIANALAHSILALKAQLEAEASR